MHQDKHTLAHMLIGGDFHAQVGANVGPHATNDERAHGAIDSEYVGSTHVARKTAEDSSSGTGQPNTSWYRQTRSSSSKNKTTTKQHTEKQKTLQATRPRAHQQSLVQTPKRRRNNGQMDMHGDHKAVIARIKPPLDHITP